MWGILLAHWAIRELMCRAADEAELDPDRISITHPAPPTIKFAGLPIAA
jgi:hypothetical protein